MISFMPRLWLLTVLVSAVWLAPTPAAATDPASSSQPAPAGIVVDAEGNVYVSDYALDRLVKFGPDGTLYVTDHFNDRVQRFSSEGHFQAQLGTVQMTAASGATATAVKAAAALTAADAPQSAIASPTAQLTPTPLAAATAQPTPS